MPVDQAAAHEHGEDKPKSRRKRGGKAADDSEPAVPAATSEQRQAATEAIAAIHRAAGGEKDASGDASGGLVDELASGLVAAAMNAGRGAGEAPDGATAARFREAAHAQPSTPTDAATATADPTTEAVRAVAGLETPAPAPGSDEGADQLDGRAPETRSQQKAEPETASRPSGRRRRRAASRPAGPPAVAS
jgi:ribonuclease E